ncbi:hypothetical protein ECP02994384_1399 [Escherichia coli P0299438.4]|nr:hypothetical protein ECP02994384_1399 [Escherichia coli P0299438.4]
MRVLLRPVLVPELGLVIVKPGRESMPVFHNTRVLVEPEPKSMRNLSSGVVPAVRQPLAEDKSLLPFFSNARVIRAAGGAGALSDWLLRHIKSCQWPHGDYHHRKPSFTVMVPAQWCCAGTATTSCGPDSESLGNLLTKPVSMDD